MNRDEMKNKISMALKDPILQQGFEIICKENVELKNRISETAEQFIKAKEIIKNLIDDLTAIDGDEVKELGAVKEAEQFI